MDTRAWGAVIGLAAIAAVTSANNACLRGTQFQCTTNEQCGAGGRCELVGFCSFLDASCPGTMQRFGESAGDLANTCVQGDGGIDAANPEGPPPIDAIDAPDAGCPNDYAPLGGQPPNHVYKLFTAPTQNFNAAHNDCVSRNGYLAIPDDATELLAYEGLTTAKTWIGISDTFNGSPDDETYINTKNVPATFLAFDTANGEPNDGGGANDQDCVASDNQLMSTEKCTTKFIYICECEN
jgi:hypothetical protein